MALQRGNFHRRDDVVYNESFPLHKAIVEDRMEDLELLLCNPNIDMNLQDEQGQTPLFLSLKRTQSNSFIMRLIQAGCDVNISDVTKVTPLHLAISLSLNDIAHELIKRGANINAQEECIRLSWIYLGVGFEEREFHKKTPLHYAVQYNNLEGVCMLLYYGANVYIANSNNMTPLNYAAYKTLDEIVIILINYYSESYYMCRLVNDEFHCLPYELHAGHEGTILLIYSLFCRNAELCKLFWKKIEFKNILNNQDSNILLINFIKYLRFSASEWLEWVYLILNIFVTHRFTISHEIRSFHWDYTASFFYYVFNAFLNLNIESADRLAIMNICLSLGAPIIIPDFEEVHQHYGFNEELETLIYAYYNDCGIDSTLRWSFMPFILGLEIRSDYKAVDIIKSYFRYYNNYNTTMRVSIDYFASLLGFFSLPAVVKQEISSLCIPYPSTIIPKTLEQIPEFPTLLELSRNRVRKYIKQSNNIKYPYQFYDAVKKLNAPKLITDIISFKVPLY